MLDCRCLIPLLRQVASLQSELGRLSTRHPTPALDLTGGRGSRTQTNSLATKQGTQYPNRLKILNQNTLYLVLLS